MVKKSKKRVIIIILIAVLILSLIIILLIKTNTRFKDFSFKNFLDKKSLTGHVIAGEENNTDVENQKKALLDDIEEADRWIIASIAEKKPEKDINNFKMLKINTEFNLDFLTTNNYEESAEKAINKLKELGIGSTDPGAINLIIEQTADYYFNRGLYKAKKFPPIEGNLTIRFKGGVYIDDGVYEGDVGRHQGVFHKNSPIKLKIELLNISDEKNQKGNIISIKKSIKAWTPIIQEVTYNKDDHEFIINEKEEPSSIPLCSLYSPDPLFQEELRQKKTVEGYFNSMEPVYYPKASESYSTKRFIGGKAAAKFIRDLCSANGDLSVLENALAKGDIEVIDNSQDLDTDANYKSMMDDFNKAIEYLKSVKYKSYKEEGLIYPPGKTDAPYRIRVNKKLGRFYEMISDYKNAMNSYEFSIDDNPYYISQTEISNMRIRLSNFILAGIYEKGRYPDCSGRIESSLQELGEVIKTDPLNKKAQDERRKIQLLTLGFIKRAIVGRYTDEKANSELQLGFWAGRQLTLGEKFWTVGIEYEELGKEFGRQYEALFFLESALRKGYNLEDFYGCYNPPGFYDSSDKKASFNETKYLQDKESFKKKIEKILKDNGWNQVEIDREYNSGDLFRKISKLLYTNPDLALLAGDGTREGAYKILNKLDCYNNPNYNNLLQYTGELKYLKLVYKEITKYEFMNQGVTEPTPPTAKPVTCFIFTQENKKFYRYHGITSATLDKWLNMVSLLRAEEFFVGMIPFTRIPGTVSGIAGAEATQALTVTEWATVRYASFRTGTKIMQGLRANTIGLMESTISLSLEPWIGSLGSRFVGGAAGFASEFYMFIKFNEFLQEHIGPAAYPVSYLLMIPLAQAHVSPNIVLNSEYIVASNKLSKTLKDAGLGSLKNPDLDIKMNIVRNGDKTKHVIFLSLEENNLEAFNKAALKRFDRIILPKFFTSSDIGLIELKQYELTPDMILFVKPKPIIISEQARNIGLDATLPESIRAYGEDGGTKTEKELRKQSILEWRARLTLDDIQRESIARGRVLNENKGGYEVSALIDKDLTKPLSSGGTQCCGQERIIYDLEDIIDRVNGLFRISDGKYFIAVTDEGFAKVSPSDIALGKYLRELETLDKPNKVYVFGQIEIIKGELIKFNPLVELSTEEIVFMQRILTRALYERQYVGFLNQNPTKTSALYFDDESTSLIKVQEVEGKKKYIISEKNKFDEIIVRPLDAVKDNNRIFYSSGKGAIVIEEEVYELINMDIRFGKRTTLFLKDGEQWIYDGNNPHPANPFGEFKDPVIIYNHETGTAYYYDSLNMKKYVKAIVYDEDKGIVLFEVINPENNEVIQMTGSSLGIDKPTPVFEGIDYPLLRDIYTGKTYVLDNGEYFEALASDGERTVFYNFGLKVKIGNRKSAAIPVEQLGSDSLDSGLFKEGVSDPVTGIRYVSIDGKIRKLIIDIPSDEINPKKWVYIDGEGENQKLMIKIGDDNPVPYDYNIHGSLYDPITDYRIGMYSFTVAQDTPKLLIHSNSAPDSLLFETQFFADKEGSQVILKIDPENAKVFIREEQLGAGDIFYWAQREFDPGIHSVSGLYSEGIFQARYNPATKEFIIENPLIAEELIVNLETKKTSVRNIISGETRAFRNYRLNSEYNLPAGSPRTYISVQTGLENAIQSSERKIIGPIIHDKEKRLALHETIEGETKSLNLATTVEGKINIVATGQKAIANYLKGMPLFDSYYQRIFIPYSEGINEATILKVYQVNGQIYVIYINPKEIPGIANLNDLMIYRAGDNVPSVYTKEIDPTDFKNIVNTKRVSSKYIINQDEITGRYNAIEKADFKPASVKSAEVDLAIDSVAYYEGGELPHYSEVLKSHFEDKGGYVEINKFKDPAGNVKRVLVKSLSDNKFYIYEAEKGILTKIKLNHYLDLKEGQRIFIEFDSQTLNYKTYIVEAWDMENKLGLINKGTDAEPVLVLVGENMEPTFITPESLGSLGESGVGKVFYDAENNRLYVVENPDYKGVRRVSKDFTKNGDFIMYSADDGPFSKIKRVYDFKKNKYVFPENPEQFLKDVFGITDSDILIKDYLSGNVVFSHEGYIKIFRVRGIEKYQPNFGRVLMKIENGKRKLFLCEGENGRKYSSDEFNNAFIIIEDKDILAYDSFRKDVIYKHPVSGDIYYYSEEKHTNQQIIGPIKVTEGTGKVVPKIYIDFGDIDGFNNINGNTVIASAVDENGNFIKGSVTYVTARGDSITDITSDCHWNADENKLETNVPGFPSKKMTQGYNSYINPKINFRTPDLPVLNPETMVRTWTYKPEGGNPVQVEIVAWDSENNIGLFRDPLDPAPEVKDRRLMVFEQGKEAIPYDPSEFKNDVGDGKGLVFYDSEKMELKTIQGGRLIPKTAGEKETWLSPEQLDGETIFIQNYFSDQINTGGQARTYNIKTGKFKMTRDPVQSLETIYEDVQILEKYKDISGDILFTRKDSNSLWIYTSDGKITRYKSSYRKVFLTIDEAGERRLYVNLDKTGRYYNINEVSDNLFTPADIVAYDFFTDSYLFLHPESGEIKFSTIKLNNFFDATSKYSPYYRRLFLDFDPITKKPVVKYLIIPSDGKPLILEIPEGSFKWDPIKKTVDIDYSINRYSRLRFHEDYTHYIRTRQLNSPLIDTATDVAGISTSTNNNYFSWRYNPKFGYFEFVGDMGEISFSKGDIQDVIFARDSRNGRIGDSTSEITKSGDRYSMKIKSDGDVPSTPLNDVKIQNGAFQIRDANGGVLIIREGSRTLEIRLLNDAPSSAIELDAFSSKDFVKLNFNNQENLVLRPISPSSELRLSLRANEQTIQNIRTALENIGKSELSDQEIIAAISQELNKGVNEVDAHLFRFDKQRVVDRGVEFANYGEFQEINDLAAINAKSNKGVRLIFEDSTYMEIANAQSTVNKWLDSLTSASDINLEQLSLYTDFGWISGQQLEMLISKLKSQGIINDASAVSLRNMLPKGEIRVVLNGQAVKILSSEMRVEISDEQLNIIKPVLEQRQLRDKLFLENLKRKLLTDGSNPRSRISGTISAEQIRVFRKSFDDLYKTPGFYENPDAAIAYFRKMMSAQTAGEVGIWNGVLVEASNDIIIIPQSTIEKFAAIDDPVVRNTKIELAFLEKSSNNGKDMFSFVPDGKGSGKITIPSNIIVEDAMGNPMDNPVSVDQKVLSAWKDFKRLYASRCYEQMIKASATRFTPVGASSLESLYLTPWLTMDVSAEFPSFLTWVKQVYNGKELDSILNSLIDADIMGWYLFNGDSAFISQNPGYVIASDARNAYLKYYNEVVAPRMGMSRLTFVSALTEKAPVPNILIQSPKLWSVMDSKFDARAHPGYSKLTPQEQVLFKEGYDLIVGVTDKGKTDPFAAMQYLRQEMGIGFNPGNYKWKNYNVELTPVVVIQEAEFNRLMLRYEKTGSLKYALEPFSGLKIEFNQGGRIIKIPADVKITLRKGGTVSLNDINLNPRQKEFAKEIYDAFLSSNLEEVIHAYQIPREWYYDTGEPKPALIYISPWMVEFKKWLNEKIARDPRLKSSLLSDQSLMESDITAWFYFNQQIERAIVADTLGTGDLHGDIRTLFIEWYDQEMRFRDPDNILRPANLDK